MSVFQKLGPHIQEIQTNTDAWVLNCPTIKSVGVPNVFDMQMPPGALTIYRKYTTNQDINADGASFAQSVIGDLNGRRVSYIEGYNETSQNLNNGLQQYAVWMEQFVGQAHAQGYAVACFSFSTGQPQSADWDYLRGLGWLGCDAISVHAYWCRSGFTTQNALHFATLWQPGDPPILITECGVDAVDGCSVFGFLANGFSDDDFAGQLESYDATISGYNYVLGATVFTDSSEPQWANGNIDPLAAIWWSLGTPCGNANEECCSTSPPCNAPYVCVQGTCQVVTVCPCTLPSCTTGCDPIDNCSCAAGGGGGTPVDYTPYLVVGGVALATLAVVAISHHRHQPIHHATPVPKS